MTDHLSGCPGTRNFEYLRYSELDVIPRPDSRDANIEDRNTPSDFLTELRSNEQLVGTGYQLKFEAAFNPKLKMDEGTICIVSQSKRTRVHTYWMPVALEMVIQEKLTSYVLYLVYFDAPWNIPASRFGPQTEILITWKVSREADASDQEAAKVCLS